MLCFVGGQGLIDQKKISHRTLFVANQIDMIRVSARDINEAQVPSSFLFFLSSFPVGFSPQWFRINKHTSF